MNTQTDHDTVQRTPTTASANEALAEKNGRKTAVRPGNMLPVKLTLDVIILLFLALEYQKRAISMQFHEIGGLALGGLFLVHKLLNLRWIRSVTAGIFRRRMKLKLLWVVDALLTLFMAAVIITGLLISKTLPTAIQNGNGIKAWHYFCAAAAMICTGVHLGLHWPMIRKAMWSKVPLRGNTKKAVGILLVCAVTVYGGYSFVTGSSLRWLSQPFTTSASMGGMGYPGHMPEKESAETSVSPEAQDAVTGDKAAEAAGDNANNGTASTAQPGEMRGFGGNGKMPSGGSFGSACATILSYGSVILLFAVLTAILRDGAGLLKKRSVLKKQSVAY